VKPTALLYLAVACLFAATGVSQEVRKDKITYDMSHLEKAHGIKFKAAKLQRQKAKSDTLITITLEFTKDLAESKILEFKGGASSYRTVLPVRDLLTGKTLNGSQLLCYFFDEDGVVFAKQAPGKIDGVVSGKEGDAFRISQSVSSDVLAMTRKISFRQEPAKKAP
jgi:hypothetical protein